MSLGTAAAATPKCFGGAARDPKHPCTNPTLSVTPTPDTIEHELGTPCTPVKQQVDPPVCGFGAPPSKAKEQFAIVGDSHVSHWRAALQAIGKIKRWRGLSMLGSGCYFSEAVKRFLEGPRVPCTAWYESVLRYLRDHPKIATLFVTQNTDTPVIARPGQTEAATKVAGFERTWTKKLPKTIKHVIVIRDGPKSTADALDCVRDTIVAAIQAAGPACALPRSVALQSDTAIVAAKRLHSSRYQYIDLTHYFCDAERCYPVIGGVLVNSDSFGHLTQTYTRSLAPFMLRRLRVLMASW